MVCSVCGSELTDLSGPLVSRQDSYARRALRALHDLRESLGPQHEETLRAGLDVVIRHTQDIVRLMHEWRHH